LLEEIIIKMLENINYYLFVIVFVTYGVDFELHYN